MFVLEQRLRSTWPGEARHGNATSRGWVIIRPFPGRAHGQTACTFNFTAEVEGGLLLDRMGELAL